MQQINSQIDKDDINEIKNTILEYCRLRTGFIEWVFLGLNYTLVKLMKIL
ncbi:MAG: hypothetical protein QW350_04780 [Candidatus Aenigmatarchaeota archaeon]|nr:hypothetical protein [Candidatus Aenigmarchaeota archaeon]